MKQMACGVSKADSFSTYDSAKGLSKDDGNNDAFMF